MKMRLVGSKRSQGAVPRTRDEVEAFVRAGLAAERVYAFTQASDLYDRALNAMRRLGPGLEERRCEVLLLQEAALDRLGRRTDQLAAIDEALAIADVLDDEARRAAVLLRRSGACTYLGQHAQACQAAERACEIYRRIADQPGEAEALRELGFAYWHAENYAAALVHARAAHALHQRLDDLAGEATALHNLAEIHRGLGSPQQAAR